MPQLPAAETDDGGAFALVGVKPGPYKVVAYKLVPKKGAKMPADLDLMQIEASGLGEHALPKKYSQIATTTLVAEVQAGSNTVELKADGK